MNATVPVVLMLTSAAFMGILFYEVKFGVSPRTSVQDRLWGRIRAFRRRVKIRLWKKFVPRKYRWAWYKLSRIRSWEDVCKCLNRFEEDN
jgi:hypothetical protein